MATPSWLLATMRTPCQIVNRIKSGTDEYGNVTYIETTLDAVCFMQPVSAEEIQDGRAEVGSYLLHFPAELAGSFDGFSRVIVGGISYEAASSPQIFPDIDTATIHHVELMVVRSTA